MSLYYEHTVRLDGRDVDGHGICKASALLGHLQEAATLAAEHGGFGRQTLMDGYGAVWMLARSWFRLDRPIYWEDQLTIRTWHRGVKAALMYRDYDIFAHGRPIGESVSGWVLANADSHKLLRLGDIRELADTGGGELCKDMHLSRLRMPEDMTVCEERPMRFSDMDINGHVNNTRYADFACDALHLERLPANRFLQSMQIGYIAECRPGESIALSVGGDPNRKMVRGMDSTGKTRFDAALNFGEVRH